jgi:YgiT-type zinc finger domain-containing protein
MKCAVCHNEMENRKGMIDLRISGRLYFVKNVGYEECSVCGERTLSPKVSQSLFEKIKNKQFIEEMIKIPVMDYA